MRGRGSELPCKPLELLRTEISVVISGYGAVESDDAEPVDVVHPVLGSHRLAGDSGIVVQVDRESLPLIMVAHHPDHRGSHAGRDRLDDLPQAEVGIPFTEVGEITREDEGRRVRAGLLQLLQGATEVAMGVDRAIERSLATARIGTEEMCVAEMGDHVSGRRY